MSLMGLEHLINLIWVPTYLTITVLKYLTYLGNFDGHVPPVNFVRLDRPLSHDGGGSAGGARSPRPHVPHGAGTLDHPVRVAGDAVVLLLDLRHQVGVAQHDVVVNLQEELSARAEAVI